MDSCDLYWVKIHIMTSGAANRPKRPYVYLSFFKLNLTPHKPSNLTPIYVR